MPQLDGLRALAVSGVLVHHLLDPGELPPLLAKVAWGALGVKLFFVLSGFLITGLLLQARKDAAASGESNTAIIKRFYLRRACRIFPLYYVVLLLAWLFGRADAREQLPWLATYSYNLWLADLGWYPAYFSHFWSLCVEEQFYLLWPWVVVLVPVRRLRMYAAVMIVLAVAYRGAAISLEFNPVAYYVLTPTHLDALGAGALLALATGGQPASAAAIEKRLRLLCVPTLVLLASSSWMSEVNRSALYDACIAFIFVWMVAAATCGLRGGWRMLESAPFVYLGRISYGLYVYHLLVPPVLATLLEHVVATPPRNDSLGFAVHSGLTFIVATLSWYTFERPLNRLRDRTRRSRPSNACSDRQAGAGQ